MKVTLLGDSIRAGVGNVIAGYGKRAAELLSPEFQVYQPVENCRFAKYTLRMLYDHANAMEGSRIVHWNNGHWDICDLWGDGSFSNENEYVENMLRIARILKSRHDIVIFATTTPVRDENVNNKNSTVERFNSIIVPELQREGVMINDLHALLVGDKMRYIAEDMIHLSADGVEVCAKAVERSIRSASALIR
jgi:lysophospholipase L1-like esterase